jgi:hypothetical protein
MYLLAGVSVVCADSSDLMKNMKQHDQYPNEDDDDDRDHGKGHDEDDDDDKDRGKGYDKDKDCDKDHGRGHDQDDNCDDDQEADREADMIAERIEVKDNMSLPGLVIRFHNQEGTWPRNIQELRKYIQDNQYEFDLDAVKDLKLNTTADGGVNMQLHSLSGGAHKDAKVEIRITPPTQGKMYVGRYSLVSGKLESKRSEIVFKVDLSGGVRITIE